MATQLGDLRDALIEAGASAEKAGKASAEVAAYENRIVVNDAIVKVALGLVVALIGISIAAWLNLWVAIGDLKASNASIMAQLADIKAAVTHK